MLSLEHLWIGKNEGVRCRMVRICVISDILEVYRRVREIGSSDY
jgi:hypothetical protein